MIPLETIHVAKPCPADWDAMDGDAQVRHCGSCRKNVYNLSEMTRAQAEALITEHEGHLCVRFFARVDGTILTQDCPVGLRAFRLAAARKFSYAAALLLSCLAGLGRGGHTAATHAAPARHGRPMMGKPAAPRPPTPGWTAGAPMMPPRTTRRSGWTGGAMAPPRLTHTLGRMTLQRAPKNPKKSPHGH